MEMNKEQELAAIRKDLKEMIVRDLSLEDINPADIKDDEALGLKTAAAPALPATQAAVA